MPPASHYPHGASLPAGGGGGLRRLLLGAGFVRAAWMFCLFGAIGFGLVIVFRCGAGGQPLFYAQPIVLVSLLVAGPIGFLAGIGAFDYWVYYALGFPTRAE